MTIKTSLGVLVGMHGQGPCAYEPDPEEHEAAFFKAAAVV